MVENRAGANGMIAAEGVAHAEADGYTVLACNSSTITLNKTLFKDIRYDPNQRLRAADHRRLGAARARGQSGESQDG